MAAKKTTAKKTETTETASLRDRIIGLQVRSLEMQESAFDRTFDAVVSVQERAEDRVHSWLDKSERMPAEAKKIVEEWIGFNQTARKGYKSAVNKSFDLGQKWFEGMKQTA